MLVNEHNEDGSVMLTLDETEVELLLQYAFRKLAEEAEKKYKTAALFKEKDNG